MLGSVGLEPTVEHLIAFSVHGHSVRLPIPPRPNTKHPTTTRQPPREK